MAATAARRDVGVGIASVRSGTEVTCPRVSRTEGMKPVAGVFVSTRIWIVPAGAKLVMTLAGEVRAL
jgi:hypothetical protein